jgi:sec-independent protein translocase protein TatA
MFGFNMPALMIILAIILVVFGARRLPEIGSAFGKGIRNFKKATDETDEIELNPKEGSGNKNS